MAKAVKRLYRSLNNRLIAGVCGGIGEYLDVDPTIIRIIYLILLIFTAIIPFTIIYIILWVIIPENPKGKTSD